MGNENGKETDQEDKRNGSTNNVGQLKPALSQLESLATTVPLNVSPPQLGGRHTPTRRSLQRSRLINLHLAGRRVPRMRYYRFLILLVVIQLLVGVTLTGISIYATTVSPSLRIRDLPHWAGVPLSLSGVLGIFYIARCYGGFRVNTVANIFKAFSVTLASISVILCVCALAFLTVHLVTFSKFEHCENVPYPAVSTRSLSPFGELVSSEDLDQEEEDEDPSTTVSHLVSCTCFRDSGALLRRRYVYELIACEDVLALIKFLFIINCILTGTGAIVGAVYVLLLWTLRYKDIYVGVKTGPEVVDRVYSSS